MFRLSELVVLQGDWICHYDYTLTSVTCMSDALLIFSGTGNFADEWLRKSVKNLKTVKTQIRIRIRM